MTARYDMLGLVESFPSLKRDAVYWKKVVRRLPGPKVKRPMKEPGPLTEWADARYAAAGGVYSREEVTYEFSAIALNKWARGPAPTGGSIEAARFILSVWDPSGRWSAGRFNVCRALQRWDYAHRDAFVAWARDPWWP